MNDPTPKQPTKTSTSQDFFARMGTMGELLRFMWKRKQYWLIPLIILVFALLFVAFAAPTYAPWIYTLW